MDLSAVEAIERATLAIWPALEVEADGGWLRRAANGYTKRANSIQCLDRRDGREARERILAGAEWLKSRGIAPVFRVTPLTTPSIVKALETVGGEVFDRSDVLVRPLAPGEFEVPGLLEFPRPTEATWLDTQRRLKALNSIEAATLAAIVERIEGPVRGLVLGGPGGAALASALIGVADGHAVAVNVVTAEASRRKGHARAMLAGGLAWAARNGAANAVIQVEAGNVAAQALYAALGFTKVYEYHYQRIVLS